MRNLRNKQRERIASSRIFVVLMLLTLCSFGCASNDGSRPDDRPPLESSTDSSDSAINNSDVKEAVEIEPTVVEYPDYRDPLIGVNRAVFAFNDVSYRYALIPLSKGYLKVVPDPLQRGFSNFFYNIKSPIYLVNNTLQLKPKSVGHNLLRFGINTTLGLLGFFDPAKHWFDIEKAETDFGDTLAYYGAGYGAYLVLPFLGPSDLRSGTSSLAEHFFHPLTYITEEPDTLIIQTFGHFQEFAPEAESYIPLKEESDDPYIFFRNMYLQGIQRDAEYQQ